MNMRPHKPVSMSPWRLEASESEEDAMWRLHPERQAAIAHDTASLLVRESAEAERAVMLERLKGFVDRDGIEALAELWSGVASPSLPRGLFRLFQIRQRILTHSDEIGQLINRGVESLHTIDPYVVGVEVPVSAESVGTIIDEILAGTFHGELASAFERAASLSRLIASGLLHWADSADGDDHSRALSSLAWGDVAKELSNCAERERKGLLT
jgi:hypothetical protein